MGLIPPTKVVEKDIEELEVDGVKMIFQNTPNTEAPSEMNTYIPAIEGSGLAENSPRRCTTSTRCVARLSAIR